MGNELHDAAQALLDAAMAYWSVANTSGVRGAVIWVEDGDGRLVILTRGEYRETLMANIREITPKTLAFGSSGDHA